MTVTSTVREEKEIEGRLEGEKENLPLISDNVIIYEKKCQRTYQNAIITNNLQDTKSVYTNQLYFFQKTTGNLKIFNYMQQYQKDVNVFYMYLSTEYVQDLYAETLMKTVKEQSQRYTLPNFKNYCRATVIKTVWFQGNEKHRDQLDRIKSPETDPHIYGQWIFK